MKRDFVHINDVARSIILSVDTTEKNGLCLDIGTGKATTLLELSNTIADIYGAPAPHVCGLYRLGDVRHAACLNEYARTSLQWHPKVLLADGCRDLANWIDQQLSSVRHRDV